ncbi:hypothetical protein [Maribacter sp. Hel_I_7]|uniref:hypothetical protein n=1 Tax=Maribacter sp. Hel_I_7 TaxID=1249997 RepID=UPI00047E4121|nr:hypothetical protein [Maribacter sp. Hel_I_7]
MKTLADTLGTVNLQNKVGVSPMLNDSVLKMLKSTKWQSQMAGFAIQKELLKNINGLDTRIGSILKQSDIARLAAFKSNTIFPKTVLDSLAKIETQHKSLFASFDNLAMNLPSASQIANLQYAFTGVSSELAKLAASQQKWNLFSDFEEITAKAVSINEQIVNDEGITKENLKELEDFLGKIEIKVDQIDKEESSVIWKIIAILSFLLAISGEIRNWTPKPDFATKEEINEVIKTQFSTFEKKIKEQKEFRTTKVECKVMLKPKKKTLTLDTLPPDFELIVLNINHKWALVSYLDLQDQSPRTGWIMKKYLTKK